MRGTILIATTLCFLLLSCNKNVYVYNNEGTLGDKNGLWISVDTTKNYFYIEPFYNKRLNGKRITILDNKTFIVSPYKKGKLNGWITVYEYGKPRHVGKFKKGRQTVIIMPPL